VRPPDPGLRLLEGRALLELGSLALTGPALRRLRTSRPGDGHDVLVLPGFTADDRSTGPLRRHLRAWGYHTHGWRLGRNLGPTPQVLTGLAAALDRAHGREGRRVSIIGWSLGGVYARELARRFPERVRTVITLGSPFRMRPGDRSTASLLFEPLRRRGVSELGFPSEERRPALPVPSTAIYSRTDGVVRWHTCIDAVDATHENVEVRGSHSGLGFNPAVLFVIADRLGQAEGRWRPFRPPAALRRLYPEPVSWEYRQ
jgi:pimeloyl-ACP methyl ester carboxylesterase